MYYSRTQRSDAQTGLHYGGVYRINFEKDYFEIELLTATLDVRRKELITFLNLFGSRKGPTKHQD